MIAANELRIGNLLHINIMGEQKIITVNLRFFAMMAGGRSIEEIKHDEQLSEYYQPIPLTPEILEKCGFWKQNNGWNIGEKKGYLDPIFSLFDHNGCSGELDLGLNGSDLPMPRVKYLHQLQNLYFALTGEELTINLK